MGSASLISHLQLHNCFYKRLDSVRNQHQQFPSLQLNIHSKRRGRLRLDAPHTRSTIFRRVVCFAAVEDDVSEKQQDSTSTSSLLEDRPGKIIHNDPISQISFFSFLFIGITLSLTIGIEGNRIFMWFIYGPVAMLCKKGICYSDDSLPKNFGQDSEGSPIYNFLYPEKELLPEDKEMSLFDHLEELRERIFISVLAVGAAILGCFAFSKELVMVLEAPVKSQGVRFLQLAPGEFFFTTLKVSGYCGLLLGSPVILYEIIAFVLPGLTKSERRFLGPIVFGSSILFYAGIIFSYLILTPAALNFFVSYAEGAVESLWSIDQYFEFVLVLMFSTGLSFQVPVIQILLGQVGLVSGDQMLSIWRYVVVGAVVAAAVITPSTDPLTQMLLAGPLLGLYFGGAWFVKLTGR
ncbi:hypothetical protein DKX38_015660 [Salix brachista]|uniref:Sec-independent protein translocase protein TATC, chloroplastic n=1 Tax=Salix brachista TaxID=2182728 RepID=A0A5N5L5T9_9ROSI|nr:hypothetical protein DKX38_015660 [Salix brachista]